MQRLSWKYIAGFVDGEGCLDVQIVKQVYVRPRVRIAQTAVAAYVLECLQQNFGGYLYPREARTETERDSVSWELIGYNQVCPFLRNVVNHLYIKQEQAKFLLWMEGHVKGKQVSVEARTFIRDELKAMKRDPHRLSEEAQDKLILLL
jgi:hypothetical protein